MKKITTLSLALGSAIILVASSCSKKTDDATPAVSKLTTKTVTDLDGSKGSVYYSLSTGTQVTGADTATTKWDIKFKATSVFINSGTSGIGTSQAQVVSSTFETLTIAPTTGYKADASGVPAISGWYTYTATTEPQHALLTVPGKIFVVKTSAGNYAKVEMISYYKGNPNTTTADFANLATRPASSYYTFRFAYQGDGTTSLQ
ncbi:heme-binding HmuY-like protein [Mucilaginibacter gracilis]|uniref:Heme-binding HmuY-like protein n=1 Tax=Mucilaginibacter gracilis TaxID=423350 RepID=A0A495J7Z6_9SPHI|nr:HmuY family protein [Mucilaginibacter gracilis]RKR85120.1 heme-binding HmuY-like protein [Mucilaginibacter gracilis]